MSHYDQAIKHWKNHRKDRYTQQCGGPVHHEDIPEESKIRYMILDENEAVVFANDNYDTVIDYGSGLEKTERYWFASSKTNYGRLDLVLSSHKTGTKKES